MPNVKLKAGYPVISGPCLVKMPMYEGIGLISEKHAVVLDIGAAYTKVGYAGW